MCTVNTLIAQQILSFYNGCGGHQICVCHCPLLHAGLGLLSGSLVFVYDILVIVSSSTVRYKAKYFIGTAYFLNIENQNLSNETF